MRRSGGRHPETVSLLLNTGADPETLYNPNQRHHPSMRSSGSQRVAPLNLDITVDSPEMVDLLLVKRADPVRSHALNHSISKWSQVNPTIVQHLLAHPEIDINSEVHRLFRGLSP